MTTNLSCALVLLLSGCSNGVWGPGLGNKTDPRDTDTATEGDTGGDDSDTDPDDTDTDEGDTDDSDTQEDTDDTDDSDTQDTDEGDTGVTRPFFPNGIWYQRPDLSAVTLHPVGDILSAFNTGDRDATYEFDCRLTTCETLSVYYPPDSSYAGTTRCYDLPVADLAPYHLDDIGFPIDEEVMDADPTRVNEETSPNNNISVIQEDGVTGYEVNWSATCTDPDGVKYISGWSQRNGDAAEIDLTGDGLGSGSRGGSYSTSSVVVTGEELAQCDVDRADAVLLDHAVFSLLWKEILYYNSADTSSPGHTIMAYTQDSYAATYYAGSDPLLTMGSWLILDQDYNCYEEMATMPGYILCMASQEFGGPVADDSWTPGRYSFGVDQYARQDVIDSCGIDLYQASSGSWHDDLAKMLSHMNVIPEDQLSLAFPSYVFPGNR